MDILYRHSACELWSVCIHTIFVVPPGHCEAVRLLLSKGLCVDPIDHRGTPLHLAAAKNHDQVVKVLLEHGADVSCLFHPQLTRHTSVFWKCKCHKFHVTRSNDLFLEVHQSTWWAHLGVYCYVIWLTVLKRVLHLSFQPNRVAHHVFSPLMMAVCGKALKCMRLLIEVQ
jgi:hypothetical protein